MDTPGLIIMFNKITNKQKAETEYKINATLRLLFLQENLLRSHNNKMQMNDVSACSAK